jgi:glucose/arabinose dehydrogenase
MSRRGLALFTILLAFSGAAAAGAQGFTLSTERVVGGLDRPVDAAAPGDGSGRLFLVLQGGSVVIVESGQVLTPPFLSIPVSCCNERGLLGLAFHPDYAANGFFYVAYTDGQGDSVVSRFTDSGDPGRADPDSEVVLLRVAQPEPNHNGGHLAFGPDGFLYVALGDGGGGGDQHGPIGNGQELGTLLGKILRLDVDTATTPYGIPTGNPFATRPGARPEIWAYGLRNPWKFSFDRQNGDLWIADVGQGAWEEIDLQPAASLGGENYGWRRMEGRHCFNPTTGCQTSGMVLPVLEYSHAEGCSVTGGYRYRGPQQILRGVYFYADFCSGKVWGATKRCGRNAGWRTTELTTVQFPVTSFAEDEDGEIYVIEYDATNGALHRLVATPSRSRRSDREERGNCLEEKFRF